MKTTPTTCENFFIAFPNFGNNASISEHRCDLFCYKQTVSHYHLAAIEIRIWWERVSNNAINTIAEQRSNKYAASSVAIIPSMKKFIRRSTPTLYAAKHAHVTITKFPIWRVRVLVWLLNFVSGAVAVHFYGLELWVVVIVIIPSGARLVVWSLVIVKKCSVEDFNFPET